MKIITENEVYVQKNDMLYLNNSDLPQPALIFMKVFGQGITIIDNSNRYEFIKFDDPSEIEFLKSLDWIVDYNAVKDLTEEEIIELGQNVARLRNEKANEFNAKPKRERRQKYESTMAELKLLDYKMYSLRDIIILKRGELDFSLPEGVERPTFSSCEPTLEVPIQENNSEQEHQPKENGTKKFVKSIFRKQK